MPKTVLYYFEGKAIGEAIRLLLAYGGEEFEDRRIKDEEWEAFQPMMPFGLVPVLEIDGKKYAESTAIARYLGKKYKLYGSNIEEEFEIDQNVDFLNSVRDEGIAAHYETDEKVKAAKYEEMKDKFPEMVKKLDEIITKNNGHIAAGKLTWGDFVFAGSFDYLKMLLRMPNLEKQYPSFKKLIDTVYADSKVMNYAITSPKCDF